MDAIERIKSADLKFLLDNCVSRKIAEALRCVGEPVVHITELSIPPETPDQEWLELLSPAGWVLVTADSKISRRLSENQAFTAGNWLGYSLRIANDNAWKQFEEVVRLFSGLKLHAKTQGERPGFYGAEGPKTFNAFGKIRRKP